MEKKVIRGGKVAVLYSPSYGAGWYTWNKKYPQCLFSPEIVDLVESGKKDEITTALCGYLFGLDFYAGGALDLEIMWLPVGTAFKVDEYDGNEKIYTIDDLIIIA